MKLFWTNYIENNGFFIFFSFAALLLIVAGFIVPPMGVIDGSVLIGAGEINATLAIGAVLKAIDKGTPASVKHNGTEISVGDKNDN